MPELDRTEATTASNSTPNSIPAPTEVSVSRIQPLQKPLLPVKTSPFKPESIELPPIATPLLTPLVEPLVEPASVELIPLSLNGTSTESRSTSPEDISVFSALATEEMLPDKPEGALLEPEITGNTITLPYMDAARHFALNPPEESTLSKPLPVETLRLSQDSETDTPTTLPRKNPTSTMFISEAKAFSHRVVHLLEPTETPETSEKQANEEVALAAAAVAETATLSTKEALMMVNTSEAGTTKAPTAEELAPIGLQEDTFQFRKETTNSELPEEAYSMAGIQSENTPFSTLDDVFDASSPSNTNPAEPVLENNLLKDTPKPISPPTDKKLFIKTIEIKDVTLLSKGQLQDVTRTYENRYNTFEDLTKLTDQLSELYRTKGYMTSKVYLPKQKIQNNTLVLQAEEGKVGDIEVISGTFIKKHALWGKLDVADDGYFNSHDLKRTLRRLNANPDLKVVASLKAGDEPGETDLVLKMNTRNPYHGGLFWDNLGRESTGYERLGAKFSSNSMLTLGDQNNASINFSRRTASLVNQYSLPIGAHGTSLLFDYAYSKLHLEEEFEILNIQGKSKQYTVGISQEWLNTDKKRIWTDVNFDYKDNQTFLLGELFLNDKVSILRPSLNFDFYDKWGRTFMRHEASVGLDAFGGTSGDTFLASRAGAGTRFAKYNGMISRTQRLPWHVVNLSRLNYQVSSDLLPSTEQFQVGGSGTVRGYIEGKFSGDSAVVFSSEFHVPFILFPKSFAFPGTRYKLRDNIAAVFFTDMGGVLTNEAGTEADRNDLLMSVGVGVRVRVTSLLNARFDMGIPLLKQYPESQRPRIHFGLESNLF